MGPAGFSAGKMGLTFYFINLIGKFGDKFEYIRNNADVCHLEDGGLWIFIYSDDKGRPLAEKSSRSIASPLRMAMISPANNSSKLRVCTSKAGMT